MLWSALGDVLSEFCAGDRVCCWRQIPLALGCAGLMPPTSYSSIESVTLGGQRHLTIPEAAIRADRLTSSIRTLQPPPEPGLVADAGMAALDFLCIFLCVVVPAGAMLFDPDAPDTVSVDPPAFGLLIPVPPCPTAARALCVDGP